ncbi:hypothetical protein GCM10010505_40420 [Kitasatospora aburaviensis]
MVRVPELVGAAEGAVVGGAVGAVVGFAVDRGRFAVDRGRFAVGRAGAGQWVSPCVGAWDPRWGTRWVPSGFRNLLY